jgi:hypothetical protein
MKVVILSALRTGRPYTQEIIVALISITRLSRTRGHSAAGETKSMERCYSTIRNRTHDFPACGADSQFDKKGLLGRPDCRQKD